MTLDCPACGKTNGQASESACERCGCDLSRLRSVSDAAALRLSLAAECLRARDWAGAIRQAEASWRLQHTPAAARLAFLAAWALGHAHKAIGWRLREKKSSHG